MLPREGSFLRRVVPDDYADELSSPRAAGRWVTKTTATALSAGMACSRVTMTVGCGPVSAEVGVVEVAAMDHGRRRRSVYRRAGRPCPRCGEPIRSRGQGEANRIAYWCPGCQRGDGPPSA